MVIPATHASDGNRASSGREDCQCASGLGHGSLLGVPAFEGESSTRLGDGLGTFKVSFGGLVYCFDLTLGTDLNINYILV